MTPKKNSTLFSAALAAGILCICSQAHAALTFTAISPDVTITNVPSGVGTSADPIILMETVSGSDVTIRIEGVSTFGNLTNTVHSDAFWLRKIVLNDTGSTWTFFDHELQSVLGTASTNGDGLSFGQGSGLTYTSDSFTTVNQITDTRDFINFSGGSVAPGASVTFDYLISHNGSADPVYLRQRPNFNPTASVPDSGSLLAIFGACITGMLTFRKFRRTV